MKLSTLRAPPAVSVETPSPPAAPKPPVPAPAASTAPPAKGASSADTVEASAKPKLVAAPELPQVRAGKASLRMGQQGPAVGEVQRQLGLPVTGRFDKNTEVAVALLQKAEGLPTTGVVDAKTLAALEARTAAKAKATAAAPSGSTPSGSTPSGSTPSGGTPSVSTPSGSAPSLATPSLASPPPKSASHADKYNYAAHLLETGKVKPGKSAAADAMIATMIAATNGPITSNGKDPTLIETKTARTRFLTAAKAAGYTVPAWAL
jgi:peptidoglycan hydrolase-like protein with peptidoglycan-binding domain